MKKEFKMDFKYVIKHFLALLLLLVISFVLIVGTRLVLATYYPNDNTLAFLWFLFILLPIGISTLKLAAIYFEDKFLK